MSSDDEERFANLQFGAAVLGALALSLQDFAAQIIARGRKARLTRSALDEIRQICVLNTKNSHMSGFPIEQEAEVFRQAIDQLEKFMEGAVERGWEM